MTNSVTKNTRNRRGVKRKCKLFQLAHPSPPPPPPFVPFLHLCFRREVALRDVTISNVHLRKYRYIPVPVCYCIYFATIQWQGLYIRLRMRMRMKPLSPVKLISYVAHTQGMHSHRQCMFAH